MSDPNLKAALSSTLRNVQTELGRLLEERGRLATWQQLGAPPDAEPVLGDAIAKVDRDIGHLLAKWGQMGGSVELRLPGHFSSGTTPPVVTRRRSATPVMMAPGRSSSRGFEGTSSHALRSDIDPNWRDAFAEVMGQMGPGQDLAGELDIVIEAAVSCDRWSRWPKYVQRHLVGLLACRLRALQDEQGVPEYELQDGFSALTRFSKRVKPGFVFGLSRGHRPQHGKSWDDDAERHWDQLMALIPPRTGDTPDQGEALSELESVIGELDGESDADKQKAATKRAVSLVGEALEAGIDSRDPRLVSLALPLAGQLKGRSFQRLRRALHDATAPEVDADGEVPDVDAAWGWWVHTRGRRGVLVGSDVEPADLERLKSAFGFKELSRVGLTDPDTAMTALRNQVEAGAVDLILLLGPDTGALADRSVLPSARDRKISWAHVDRGRGVRRVQSAIERFLEREGEATL